MKTGRLTFQATAVLLVALLITSGCTSTSPIRVEGLQDQLSAPSSRKIYLKDHEGGTTRLDPNSEIRFIINAHEATPWIKGKDLWVSKAGLSFEMDRGVHFLQWHEVTATEVRNLSGGKTFGAMVFVVVVIGVVVALIASKGGGGGSSGGSGISGGKSRAPRGKRSWRRRSRGRSTGVHLHLPLIIATHHSAPRMDAPPPPPPPMAPPPMAPPPMAPPPSPPPGMSAPAPASAANATVPGGNPELAQAFEQIDKETADQAPAEAVKASRLFTGSLRRRSLIQFMGQAAGGGDLYRLEGPTLSVLAGLRLGEAFDVGGGFRHLTTSVPGDGRALSSFIGVGRIGAHLTLDTAQRFAIPFSLDIGAGQNVRYHFKLNLGLRIQLPYRLTVGLMPFNPAFTVFKDDTPMAGARRWTFPTTLELGFSY